LIRATPVLQEIDPALLSRLDADAKYHVYIERQKRDMERQREDEKLEIPPDFDFESLSGLSNELKLRFQRSRPTTVGHASRLEGATPAALLLLAAHARRLRKSAP
jgi:tRNA uridine 5-carboxymethylaminomethyl modification enzyme